jgi:hypothetical protein
MSKKKTFLCLFLYFQLTPILLAPLYPAEKSGGSDVQGLIDSWVAMWNSYDLRMVDKLFLQDSQASYFSSEKEGLILGIEAVRDHHVGFGFVEGGKSQENKLWVGDIHVSEFGTAAVVAGIWYFQRASEEPATIQKGPFTFVCVKTGQEWRLAHLNFSEYK